MPNRDGRGPMGGNGPGSGRGLGMGGGSGAGGGRGMGSGGGTGAGGGRGRNSGNAYGPGGSCICATCHIRVQHQVGVSCLDLKCPQCGKPMIREELYNERKED